jgi:hypothetical protein
LAQLRRDHSVVVVVVETVFKPLTKGLLNWAQLEALAAAAGEAITSKIMI